MESSEQKIKEAARELFLEKGFSGAKIRDIAQRAGMNVALVNYYFRTKEHLFREVFQESFFEVFRENYGVFGKAIPLEEKIRTFVDSQVRIFQENPHLPAFLFSELRSDPEGLLTRLSHELPDKFAGLQEHLEAEAREGRIRRIDPLQLETCIAGLVVFPFLFEPVMRHMKGLDDEGFQEFIEERREIIVDMIMSYLRNVPQKEGDKV